MNHTFVVAIFAAAYIATIAFVIGTPFAIVVVAYIFVSISPAAVSGTPSIARIVIVAEKKSARSQMAVAMHVKIGIAIGIVETFLVFGSKPITELGSSS